MASVQELGDGKYKIFVELGYNERGKRIRKTKTITATSQRDLNKKVREFELKCFNEKDEPIKFNLASLYNVGSITTLNLI